MSDIYMPGVRSRLNTDKLIEDLMKVERIPRDRAEKQIETYQAEKGYWQEVGRRVTALRDSARFMYSFQNPFAERSARSSDESVLIANATRQAVEQERSFSVKQVAKADRFLSDPLELNYKVEPGKYTFTVGSDEITVDYRGGTLRDFTEILNRRGRGKIQANVINVESGKQSLLIESLVTGAENRLSFSGAAEDLARTTRLGAKAPVQGQEPVLPERVMINADAVTVKEGDKNTIAFSQDAQALSSQKGIILNFETSTKVTPTAESEPIPSGPAIPSAGSVIYGGITIENDPSYISLPKFDAPPPPVRIDDMAFLSLAFSDGTSAALPLVQDSAGFIPSRINLDEVSGGRTVSSMEIVNNNTNRELSIRNVTVFNPNPPPGQEITSPNILSSAQDAIVVMEGIEIKRSSNEISDLIPGVTIIAKKPSDTQVTVNVEPDRDSIKEAIVTLVGNYNRLVAELNVLTRKDDRVLQEITYLTADERTEMKERLGAFSGDMTLIQFKNRLQQSVTGAYITEAERDLSMLVQIGVGTDLRRAGATTGYDPSQLRGYLEIDEKVLDAALAGDLRPIQQLFGYDTTGDLIADSGVAVTLDSVARPLVETGGIVSIKASTIDGKIKQEEQRIATLDRQLEAKELALKRQYNNMESAFNRMEKMQTDLDNFSRQANANNNARR
ncbi:MAG: flagellar filament capping protein FliD [Treponema sp.]|nr:flagellar filament capping protein FliD [Treponema sp.]